MSPQPLVTVVIPTRNRLRLLPTSVSSALAQENVDLELIVVDDGSTDETPRRLAEIDDSRLRVFRHEASRGVAAARNRGIAEARGAWVATLDDDDVWAPDKLRRQVDAAEQRNAGFAYAGAVRLDTEGQVIGVNRPPEPDLLAAELRRSSAIPAGSSNVLVRTDLLRAAGGFDEQLFHLADWDLWLRLAGRAPAAAVRETLVGYLKHSGNMLTERGRDPLSELSYLAAKHGEDMRVAGVNLTHWMAVNHLQAGRRRTAVAVYVRGALRYRCGRHLLRGARAALSPDAVRRSRQPDRSEPLTDADWTPEPAT